MPSFDYPQEYPDDDENDNKSREPLKRDGCSEIGCLILIVIFLVVVFYSCKI